MPLSNYLPSSRLIQPGVCTSSTRPASPFEGQMIYETDTDETMIWLGSSWAKFVRVVDNEDISTTGKISANTFDATNYQKSGVSRGLVGVAQMSISASATPTFYVINLPSGVSTFNLISVTPTAATNNTLTIYEMRYGAWSGVQGANQIGIYCALGNGVHLEPFGLNVYYYV